METAEEKIVSDVPEQTEGTEDVVNQRAKTVLYCGGTCFHLPNENWKGQLPS